MTTTPFRIGKSFHVIHIVSDIEVAMRWYSDVFATEWFEPRAYSDVEMRDAALGLIGDCVIEPMMMMADRPGAEEKPTGRFYKRFGQHFHSLAFFVDNHQGLYDRLKQKNVRIVAGGGAGASQAPKGGAFFTHPRDTYCQFEMMDGNRTERDPRFRPGWSAKKWRDHPLGIDLPSHTTVIVRDVAKARDLFVTGFDGKFLHEEESKATGCKSAYVMLGDQTIVELAQPIAKDSLAGQDMEKNGEIVHSQTWRVKDLNKAEQYLKSKGLRTQHLGKDLMIIDPAQALNAIHGFTTRHIPNDPRKPAP